MRSRALSEAGRIDVNAHDTHANVSSSQPPAPAREALTALLTDAVSRRASDVHIEPTAAGYEVRLRLDGLLQAVDHIDAAAGRMLVNRLMVLAELLTYRQDIPQEGRLTFVLPRDKANADRATDDNPPDCAMDCRVAIMPTTHGLRAAVRLPAELAAPAMLYELGLPAPVCALLNQFADVDAGMLLLTGPAGSGKTTTIYALLRAIAQRHAGLSIISMEDPVERDLPGVTQIEISPFGELTYARTLRSLLRQDPQVLMLGEIRDRETAQAALEASLTGHRLVSTMHAGSTGGAMARLLDMGLPPYQLTGALLGVVAQRLVRQVAIDGDGKAVVGERAGPRYVGRTPIAASLMMTDAVRLAVLASADASRIEQAGRDEGQVVDLHVAAAEAVAAGRTDAAEIARVLGGTAADHVDQ